MKPYIVCCGTHGRCVVYGWSETEPEHGKPCRLTAARMILYWAGPIGLFGLASRGPANGSRITAAVSTTETSAVTEWCAVSPEAAQEVDAWPDA